MARMIIDGHEDIAYSALAFGRDFMKSAHAQRAEEREAPRFGLTMLGLPDHLRGNVRLVFGTLYVAPASDHPPKFPGCSYSNPEEAAAAAMQQLDYYRSLANDPRVTLVTTRRELDAVIDSPSPHLGIVVLMEGAEPIVHPADADEWFEAGVRVVGLSWKGTRYAGGTGYPGPLTTAGRELLPQLERAGLILDVSHLAEESFWEALGLFHGVVIASHSNPRHFVPTDRQLSDEMIRALIRVDGVIGAVAFNQFLKAGWKESGSHKDAVTLMTLVDHIKYVCDLAGDSHHSAIGSDFDGGFGAESAPLEIDTVADLQRVGDALSDGGFGDGDIENILSENWLRILRAGLPA